jgi:hypothetical protein
MTLPNNFSLRNIGKLKNDVEVEFGISFSKKSGQAFVEFANTFSQTRIKMIFNRILTTKIY